MRGCSGSWISDQAEVRHLACGEVHRGEGEREQDHARHLLQGGVQDPVRPPGLCREAGV